MWAVDVVELLPYGQLLLEIDVVGVVEQLVELELVRQVGSLDLAVEVWTRRLDVDVPDTQVLHVPVESRLELVAIVRANRADPEREALDDVVGEVDRVGLVVLLVDLQRSDARRVVDCCVLEASYLGPARVNEVEELHVDLDVMPGDLLLVADHGRHRTLVAVDR